MHLFKLENSIKNGDRRSFSSALREAKTYSASDRFEAVRAGLYESIIKDDSYTFNELITNSPEEIVRANALDALISYKVGNRLNLFKDYVSKFPIVDWDKTLDLAIEFKNYPIINWLLSN